MKKAKLLFLIFLSFLSFFYSCNSGNNNANAIASDSVSIAKGESAFTKNCSGCHNFTQDGIGPQLAGITEKVPAQWISSFVHDPKKNIDAGDERAKKLFDQYHTVMPSFSNLGDDTLKNIIAYMNTIKVIQG